MSQQQNAVFVNSERSKDVMKIIRSSLLFKAKDLESNDVIHKFLNIESYVESIDKNCASIVNLMLEYIDDVWWETCHNSIQSADNLLRPVIDSDGKTFILKDLELELTPDVILEELMNILIDDE